MLCFNLLDIVKKIHNMDSHFQLRPLGLSQWFDIHGGVCQGCNIAPTLFNLYLDFVTKQASAALGAKVGVRVAFKHAGK
jgi:hypothetical protein